MACTSTRQAGNHPCGASAHMRGAGVSAPVYWRRCIGASVSAPARAPDRGFGAWADSCMCTSDVHMKSASSMCLRLARRSREA
eukprot:365452-Chlamydomonas_euryale.AAC.7